MTPFCFIETSSPSLHEDGNSPLSESSISNELGNRSGRMGTVPGSKRISGVRRDNSTVVKSTRKRPSAAASPTNFQTAASTSESDQRLPKREVNSFTLHASPYCQYSRMVLAIS